MTRAAGTHAGRPTLPDPTWPRLAALLAFAMIGTAACAADVKFLAPADAIALLERIQHAAQQQNYVGAFVHQQGDVVQSSRVTHMVDRAGEHEKLEMMDGQAREFIRHNDDVRCYMPDTKTVLVEKRARYDSFPALLTSPPLDFDQYYRMAIDGIDRIAGRTAQQVVLEARDKQRYGYRLWYDQASHLLLKAQTINEKGVSIEQVAFTSVAIGGVIPVADIRPGGIGTDNWHVETNRMVPVDLAKAGWSVPRPVPGFHKVMEVRRAVGGREDVGQMVYSDGLAVISIFIEPVPARESAPVEVSRGPVNIVTERHGEYWLTVVGEAPVASVRDMARQIDFKATR